MATKLEIQKPIYCGCKLGNKSKCGNIAVFIVDLCKKGIEPKSNQINKSYRCDSHKLKGTVSTKVIDHKPFDQSLVLLEINRSLIGLVGKKIKSSFHTAKYLQVKYVKDNGIMCYQPLSNKWKYVYPEQIDYVL